MTNTRDNSSLPLLLSITGAVLAIVACGWFLLYRQSSLPPTGPDTTVTVPATSATVGDQPTQVEEPKMTAGAEKPAATAEVVAIDIDAELRKARLAADADMLVSPPTQSALYYYARVIEAEPGHALAIAELDGVLGSVALMVSRHLDDGELEAAYDIAALVATQSPEHELVTRTQLTLDALAEERVAAAIQHAQDGDQGQALEMLATARALPGRNPDYLTAIRDSITEIQNVRLAAEEDRARRAQLASSEAKEAWMAAVRQAIVQGNLVSPAGASARDLLAEGNGWSSERGQLMAELVTALTDLARINIGIDKLNDAENLLAEALELGGDPGEFADLRASLNQALIDAESGRVANLNELVQLKTVTPTYPRRARERNISGWVDVYFTITPAGRTTEITVRKSEPGTVFDKAAMGAVEKWEFQPIEYRGQIISQRAAARLAFRLE